MAAKPEALARFFTALSDPTRLRLVLLLARRGTEKGCGCGSLCVNALAHRLGLTQSAVSQHLRVLRHVGLVHGERKGAFVHYSVDKSELSRQLLSLREAVGIGAE